MRIPQRKAGFTLIELMVAMAVVGILSVVIYRLFDVTSQNFREVDELASLNERVRFGTERVRVLIQGAATLSTPDSDTDPYVRPQLAGARVVGISHYADWQNAVHPVDAVAAANPNSSFDGLILMGAYDFGMSFEMSGLEGEGAPGRLELNDRSLYKIIHQNPFSYMDDPPTDLTSVVTAMGATADSRLLRILDSQGFMQFALPESLAAVGTTVEVALPSAGDTFAPKFRQGGSFEGLNPVPEGDVGYDTAFIDAFWLRTKTSTANPSVLNLVVERLCASEVAEQLAAGAATFDPATLPNQCQGGEAQTTVIASHVADFQVWFDCTAEPDGALSDATWSAGWLSEDDCLEDGDRTPRVGHVRLALHTHQERPDQRHFQFEDATGETCDTETLTCDDELLRIGTLRTFDFVPGNTGAAQVVVMQTDFELTNYAARNARP